MKISLMSKHGIIIFAKLIPFFFLLMDGCLIFSKSITGFFYIHQTKYRKFGTLIPKFKV